MEILSLDAILEYPCTKLIDSCALRGRNEGINNLLLHLYDCKLPTDIMPWTLDDFLDCLDDSKIFLSHNDVNFTQGVINETNYILKCLTDSMGYIQFREGILSRRYLLKGEGRATKYRKSGLEKIERLKQVQSEMYEFMDAMRKRKIEFEGEEGEKFLELHKTIIQVSRENNLKTDNSVKYDTPRSKSVKDSHTDEEIIAAALVLAQKGKHVKILTSDWDIDSIAWYFGKYYDSFDKNLFGEILEDIKIYHPGDARGVMKNSFTIKRFTGERFGDGIFSDSVYARQI